MPEISRFYGINIYIYPNDHNPPHFHAVYGNKEALFRIDTLEIMKGYIPKSQQLLVMQWAYLHRDELIEAWKSAVMKKEKPKKIKPLE